MPPPTKRRPPRSYGKEELKKLFAAGEIAPSLTKENLARFAQGQLTLAELSGLTREECYGFAAQAQRMWKVGKQKEALKIAEGLVAANPKDGFFHAMLGAMHGRLGDEAKAEASYALAIKHDKKNLEARVAHAELLLKKGKIQGALKDLDEAAQLDPTASTALGKRAVALAKATSEALQAALKSRPAHAPPPPPRGPIKR